jgi:hypothetical protein
MRIGRAMPAGLPAAAELVRCGGQEARGIEPMSGQEAADLVAGRGDRAAAGAAHPMRRH